MNAAENLLAEGNADAALAKLQEALAVNPANDDARFEYVKLLMAVGELDKAQTALAPAMAQIPLQLRFEALHHWGLALHFANTDERAHWQLPQFDALVEKGGLCEGATIVHQEDNAGRVNTLTLILSYYVIIVRTY